MAVQVQCFNCGKVLDYPEKVGLREECPHCKSDVHVCKNCEFYDPKVYNECRETQADPIRERDRSNRCDYYRPRAIGGSTAQDKAAALKAAADALFKKK